MRTRFIRSTLMFLLLVTPLALPIRASACACCANWGAWYERKQSMDESALQELARLRLSGKAKLFLTDGPDPEGVLLSSPAYQDFTISLSRRQSQWVLAVKGTGKDTGSLTLSIPQTAVSFGADLHDGREGGGGGPLLYKELRLDGTVSGIGFFSKGVIAGTRFRLVLQGRGNNCMAAEDFKSWNLQVFGRRAKFSFYGSFDTPGTESHK
jgi:hypothetical protein